VKALPENPSLDHLREQAKDLHRTLRKTEPATTLASAQNALANQYGFPDWGTLKAEVDKRRKAIRPADGRLAMGLSQAFGLGDLTKPMMPVTRGLEGRGVWSLETSSGRWAVKVLYDWITESVVGAGTKLAGAARDLGARTPEPVRSPQGRLIETVDGRNWRAFEWLDLRPPLTNPIPPATAERVGSILAGLHKLQLPAPGVIGWHTDRPTEAHWHDLLERARRDAPDWAPKLSAALPLILDMATISDLALETPVLCHCNLIPSNVRVGAGGELVILDWDKVGGLPATWELGQALTQWSVGIVESIDRPAAQALAEGYGATAGIAEPIDLGIFNAAISNWLLYLYGQASIALSGEESDRTQARRNTVDLLERPRTRESLESLLEIARARITPNT
jgi:Ser/Thr protein kinase RdoA (MazF antagonist)